MIYVSAAAAVAATLAVSTPASAQANNTPVERGRYLVRITGCHDCHSPKVQGMTPNLDLALSGRPASTQLPTETKTEVHASPDLTAWTGPWGYSIAANLTPDAATGLGTRYTEAFIYYDHANRQETQWDAGNAADAFRRVPEHDR
jgi:hypothetical protein